MYFEAINLIVCLFYSLVGISFIALCCLTFCGPYDYQDDEDSNLNIMSDSYPGNKRIFTRSMRRRMLN